MPRWPRAVTCLIWSVAASSALAGCSTRERSRTPACSDCGAEPNPNPNPNPDASADDLDGDGRDNSVDRCDARDFGRLIVLDPGFSTTVREVVEQDLAPLLARVRGEPFELSSRAEGGCADEQTAIWLVAPSSLADHGAPQRVVERAAELSQAAPQSYVLDAERGAGAWLVAGTERGLVHGIYELLERTGVRFLLPGDDWIVTPPRLDLSFDISELRSPVWRTLSYFGTGGWGPASSQFPVPGVGSDGGHAQQLELWRRRNRFPLQYWLGGHTWEDFSALPEVKAALDADPAMRACRPCAAEDATCLQGAQDALCGSRPDAEYRRVPSEAARLNPTHHGLALCDDAGVARACAVNEPPTLEDPGDFTSDAGLTKLYGDHVLQGPAAPTDPSLEPFVSVDASDGDGFCACDKCRDMLRSGAEGVTGVDRDANVTDAVFHLANHVARRAEQQIPGSFVNLYAYASRASVPTVSLEPNVFVVVIPNAFQQQHTGLSGDELLGAWSQKSVQNERGPFRLGVYDYWALTDGSFDQPTYPLSSVTSLLATWRQAGIEAITNESTYGSGPMGLAWYVTAHSSWQPDLDVEALVHEWFELAFGAAAAPLERMYRRFWAHGYSADPLELGEMFAALQEAELLASDEAALRSRLTALSAYVHYLRLLYELRSAPEAGRAAALDALLTHVWRIAPSGMVHSFRLWQLLTWEQQNPERWAFSSRTEHGSAWNAVIEAGPVGAEEMQALVQEGVLRYPRLQLVPENNPFTGELVPLGTPPASDELDATESGYGDEWEGEYRFYLSAGRAVSLSLTITGRGAPIPDSRIVVEHPSGEALVDRHVAVPLDGEREERVEVSATDAGVYRFIYQHAFNEFHVLRYPQSLPLVRVLPSDFSFFVPERRHWFFVPTGTRRFGFRSGCDQPTLFHGPQGEVVASWHGNVALVDVPAGQDGVAWSMSSYCGSAQFLNLPNYVGYRPEQLLVPADAR